MHIIKKLLAGSFLILMTTIAVSSPIAEPETDKVFPKINDKTEFREATKAITSNKVISPLPENPARQPIGALTGKVVYANGGHGWTSNGSTWFLQRPLLTPGIVEDFGNVDQLRIFAEYALRAGATVVPFRPVGRQLNEVVLDNDDPGVTFSPANAWVESTATEFFGSPGDTPYLFAGVSTNETAVARYTPNIPEAGFYPVYCWARDGSDRVSDQLYRIFHTGGFSEMTVNHRMVGKGWIYLGNYYFNQGTEGYVEISNMSQDSVPNGIVIADAIRFGNGMGDIVTGSGISGFSREDEASVYWIEKMAGQGASSSIWDRFGSNDQSDNVSAPTFMTAWMNREAEGDIFDRIYLGFHTNAFDPGSLGLYNGNNFSSAATPNQERWAEIIAAELNTDMVAIGSPPFENEWPDRVAQGRSLTLDRTDIEFGEIRGDRINQEMDATIIEVAAHGNQDEAEVLQDLKARRAVARGSIQAIIKYMEEFDLDGGDLTMPPDTPKNIRSQRIDDDTVAITWDEPDANGIVGDPAESYIIYQSPNGYGFADPIISNETTYNVTLTEDIKYFKVASRNAGGESPATEVIAVGGNANTDSVLIVNGFDRIDRLQNPPDEGQPGALRVRERQINSMDYVVQHAEAIKAAGPYNFVSASDEAVEEFKINLSDFDVVVWITGEQRTVTDTKTESPAISSVARNSIRQFLTTGGGLFISGSDIGFDFVDQQIADTYFTNVFKATYQFDDSNSLNFTGSGILEGFDGSITQSDQIYDADSPDVIIPNAGAETILTYERSNSAGVSYTSENDRLIYLSFPFETIEDEEDREELMEKALQFLVLQKDRWIYR